MSVFTFNYFRFIIGNLELFGQNRSKFKKILDYGKNSPSILLLDEFDAVAKRRDDPSDLGELKKNC
ncbi:AAA family ATPase [Paenibacillus larvae]|nr:AAA family ATPase [Paenibacillus larvae]